MNENLQRGDNISSLTVEDLLGLLNSPIVDVVEEVKTLLKGQFALVSDRYLINGLLEYFFSTNSKRIVDLLIAAPEPHSRYLLDKISDGIKGNKKYAHLSLLLYAVSQNPAPMWIHKPYFQNTIQAVLQYANPKQDSDISVLVTGVMIIVITLPYMPLAMCRYMNKIFSLFWSLVQWVPTSNSEQDLVLKPHLQVAVHDLFHRLYAIYPCNLLNFMKANAVNQSKYPYFVKTLRPMLERVRFHPLLVTETKDTELSKGRFIGLEPNDLMYECSKLSLDPLNDTPDDTEPVSEKILTPSNSVDCFMPLLEGSFWSPAGVGQSPSPVTKSAPPTPLYTYQARSNLSVAIAESPPEAAIEATPETTPFASPMPLVNPSPLKFEKKNVSISNAKVNLNSALDNVKGMKSATTILEQNPIFNLAPPAKISQETYKLSAKLNKIHMERTESSDDKPKENPPLEDTASVVSDLKNPSKQRRTGAVKLDVDFEEIESMRPVDLELQCAEGYNSDSESDEDTQEMPEEGLGIPSETSMAELVKNVNTRRLRFLSQCGPPPNISFSVRSPTKTEVTVNTPFTKHRSRSCPTIKHEVEQASPSTTTIKDISFSSVLVAATRIPIETSEIATQTEEIPIVNPYENLLKTLALSKMTKSHEVRSDSHPSSSDIIFNFGKIGIPLDIPELCWNTQRVSGNDVTKTQLRAMHAFALLEKTKRQTYADRNRRLLSKVKKIHSLQEKDLGVVTEKNELRSELNSVKQMLAETQEKLANAQKLLCEKVDKSVLQNLQSKEDVLVKNREHLRERCAVLHTENLKLAEELQICRNTIHDQERQLNNHMKHSKENQTMKKKLVQLDKKMLLMGEIQAELKLQLKSDKMAQRKARFTHLTQENYRLQKSLHDLEIINARESTSLDATMQRIKQLEAELKDVNQERLQQQKEVEITDSRWQEKLSILEKRNKELQAINSTMEVQMLELLRFRPEKEGQEGANASRLVPPKPEHGFPPSENLPEGFSRSDFYSSPFYSSSTCKGFDSPNSLGFRNS